MFNKKYPEFGGGDRLGSGGVLGPLGLLRNLFNLGSDGGVSGDLDDAIGDRTRSRFSSLMFKFKNGLSNN